MVSNEHGRNNQDGHFPDGGIKTHLELRRASHLGTKIAERERGLAAPATGGDDIISIHTIPEEQARRSVTGIRSISEWCHPCTPEKQSLVQCTPPELTTIAEKFPTNIFEEGGIRPSLHPPNHPITTN